MLIFLLLILQLAWSLEPDRLLQVGDCSVGGHQGLSSSLYQKAAPSCPSQSITTKVSQSDFKTILFGSSGVYAEFAETKDMEWIWKDAKYLFEKAAKGQAQIQSMSLVVSAVETLEEKYPFDISTLPQAVSQVSWFECGDSLKASIEWKQEKSWVQGDSLYFDSDIEGVWQNVYWSNTPQFQQLKPFNFDGYTLEDTLSYQELNQDSLTLWAVDSCGIAHGYQQSVNWVWQPKFYEVLSHDQDKDGLIDGLLIHTVDLLDSMIHWKSASLYHQGVELKVSSWSVIDSNKLIVRADLEKTVHEIFDETNLSLELNSTYGSRSHPVKDGVGPRLMEATLSGDSLRLVFNEFVHWGSNSSLTISERQIIPKSWRKQSLSSWMLKLNPKELQAGDSIYAVEVRDHFNHSAVPNKVMVQGPLDIEDRDLGVLSLPPQVDLKRNVKRTIFNPFIIGKKVTFGTAPIFLELPPPGQGNLIWKVQLDIYDQNAQALVNHVFEIQCDELFTSETCLKGIYDPFTLQIPWNGVNSQLRQAGVGVYIVQVKVTDILGIALQGSSKFGVRSIK